MARIGTALGQVEQVLITAKTYPMPSRGYIETTCVAAVSEKGELRRIFPVPFRLLRSDQQFKKWQWVEASLRSASPTDHRPESHKIDVDSIRLGSVLKTGRGGDWSERMRWIKPHILPSYAVLEQRRQATGETLGFLRPTRIIDLIITELPQREKDWTEEEKAKLLRETDQRDLFSEEGEGRLQRPHIMLEKLPYKFHYVYEIDTPDGLETCRHLITDWEAGELYRKCVASHGDNWQRPFRARLLDEFRKKDLVFMLGTMHRIPDQWLIISLIYPKQLDGAAASAVTLSLEL